MLLYQNFKFTNMNLKILKLRLKKSFVIVFFVKIRYTDLFETNCGWNRNFVREGLVVTLSLITLNYNLYYVTINRRFIIIYIIIEFVVAFVYVLWYSELLGLCQWRSKHFAWTRNDCGYYMIQWYWNFKKYFVFYPHSMFTGPTRSSE